MANTENASRSLSSRRSDVGGKTTIADSVVAVIAGIAARQVDGVHTLGGGASRAVRSARSRQPSTSMSSSSTAPRSPTPPRRSAPTSRTRSSA
jgi:hypothetical protein